MAISTIKTALMYGAFSKTTDVSIDSSKTYYVLDNGVYVAVASPVLADIGNYYERGTLAKLVCIKSYGGFDETKEELETTTMCDGAHTYIEGLKANSSKTFTANYDKTDYSTIRGLEGQLLDFELWFGESGADGKFEFQGTISASINDGEVNTVREMTVTVIPSTGVSFN